MAKVPRDPSLSPADRWLLSDSAPKIGDVYGEWTILRYSHAGEKGRGSSRYYYWVRCSCGHEQQLRFIMLRYGGSLKCWACHLKRPRARSKEPLAIGAVYGLWTVISAPFQLPTKGAWRVLCRCVCGTEKAHTETSLRNGYAKQCRACAAKAYYKHGGTHGGPNEIEYRTWRSMRDRCENPNNRGWSNYGGRGIQVCERWKSFENFLADLGKRPGPEYSLDRLDNDAGYEPSNCAWRLFEEQSNNRRSTRLMEFQGETLSLAQWARRQGMSEGCLRNRLREGWTIEAALTTPLDTSRLRQPRQSQTAEEGRQQERQLAEDGEDDHQDQDDDGQDRAERIGK